jgi:1-acyl-sn-glycerol-3-phosphate acyltransferase
MPFKMGAFRLALTQGVPIVPVSIKGAEKIWPVGRMLPRPGSLTLTYHPPIAVERVPEGTSRLDLKEMARALARRTHDVVATALDPSNLPDAETEPALRVETNA